MKNYPKHSNLKQHKFLSSRLVGHKSKMAWQNWIPTWAPRNASIPLLFKLLEASHSPFLLAASLWTLLLSSPLPQTLPLLPPSAVSPFSAVAQSCPTLCDPMNRSRPGLPVHHQLPEFTQTHVHWVSDAIHPSYPLSSPSPPAFNLSQHQGLFQWVSSLHQVAKVLKFQLQHQFFQWIFRTDFL